MKCVHTEHCCVEHGCKYGDKDCPVYLGYKKQSFCCDLCYPDDVIDYKLTLPVVDEETLQQRREGFEDSLPDFD